MAFPGRRVRIGSKIPVGAGGPTLNETLTFSSTSSITSFSYYPNNQLKGVQYANGLITNYTYTKLGQVSSISVGGGGLLYLGYQYNNTGTVASVNGWSENLTIAHIPVHEQYAYDPLRRLINSNVTFGTTKTLASYAYDLVGNRVAQTVNGITTRYNYNLLNNELVNSTVSGITTRYGYDGDGRLVSRTSGTMMYTETSSHGGWSNFE